MLKKDSSLIEHSSSEGFSMLRIAAIIGANETLYYLMDLRLDLMRIATSLILSRSTVLDKLRALEPLLAKHRNLHENVNKKGQTPLHFAAEEGAYHAIDFLLKQGATLDTKPLDSGCTPCAYS